MKISELAQHLHQIRHNNSGRAIGNSMKVSEVWNAIQKSDLTSIDEIKLFIEKLPSPVDGMFVRMTQIEKEIALIYVNSELPDHWRDFVIIKEMMHCFTPMESYVSTPEESKKVLSTLVERDGRYTINVAADDAAIFAAAEVISPHTTIASLLSAGLSTDEIASRHGLHPEVTKEICSYRMMYDRHNATITNCI